MKFIRCKFFLFLAIQFLSSYLVATSISSYYPNALTYRSADDKLLVGSTASMGSATKVVLARYLSTGDLDTTFGTGGIVQTALGGFALGVNAITITAGGELYIGGFAYNGSQSQMMLAKYVYATGALDTSFNGTGILIYTINDGSTVQKIAIQSDNNILAIGSTITAGIPDAFIARFDPTGTIDGTYGSGGIVQVSDPYFALTSAVIDAADSLTIGGYTRASGFNNVQLSRYTSAGILDTTFNATGTVTTAIGTNSQANALTIDGSANIIVGGNSDDNFLVARYTSAGILDTTFNTSGYNVITIGDIDNVAQVSLTGTSILLAGSTQIDAENNFALAQFTSAGVPDTSFNGTGKVTLQYCETTGLLDASIDTSSRIYGLAFANNGILLIRLMSSGSVDNSFGFNGLVNNPVPVACTSIPTSQAYNSYIYAYDTKSQGTVNAGLRNDVIFRNISGVNNSWKVINNIGFQTMQTGIFLINCSICVFVSRGGDRDVTLLAVNGNTDIPGSSVTQTLNDTKGVITISKTFMANLNAYDIIKFKWIDQVGGAILKSTLGIGSAQNTSAFVSIVRLN